MRDVTKASPRPTGSAGATWSFVRSHPNGPQTTQNMSPAPRPPVTPWSIDDALWDVVGCYGYDVNIAAVAAQAANDKHGSSAFSVVSGARAIGAS